MRSSLARWKLVTVTAATVLVAACGSAAPHSASTPPPTSPAATGSAQPGSAVCRDAVALRASLGRIASFQPGKDTLAGLRADLADANTKLAALRADPANPFSPQVAALETSLKKLRTEAASLVVNGRPAGLARVLEDVRPKVATFVAAVETQCPKSDSG